MKNYGLLLVVIFSIAIIALALIFSILQQASSGLFPGGIAGEAKLLPPGITCAYDLARAQERIALLEYENQALKERLATR